MAGGVEAVAVMVNFKFYQVRTGVHIAMFTLQCSHCSVHTTVFTLQCSHYTHKNWDQLSCIERLVLTIGKHLNRFQILTTYVHRFETTDAHTFG